MATKKKDSPPYGTIRYAAERLGVAKNTVYKLIASGHLATYKIGRAHRTTDAAIDECIARLMQENAAARSVA